MAAAAISDEGVAAPELATHGSRMRSGDYSGLSNAFW